MTLNKIIKIQKEKFVELSILYNTVLGNITEEHVLKSDQLISQLKEVNSFMDDLEEKILEFNSQLIQNKLILSDKQLKRDQEYKESKKLFQEFLLFKIKSN